VAVTPRVDDRSAPLPGDDLLNFSVSFADRWYDPAVGLVWNPAGSFAPEVRDASVHLLPQSAWYAFGLLERNGPGDHTRAVAVLDAVLGHQYDRPGTPWNGTFSRVAELGEPGDGAVEWVDYDPNWRQFIGATLVMVLRHHAERLDAVLRSRIDRALDLAVRGESADRVSPAYTNIALLKAVVEVEYGTLSGDEAVVKAGESLAAAVVARFDRFGTFDEFNSPTYAGIDLWALGMWRTCAASPQLRDWGERLERAVWDELALFFHGGLGCLAGPFVRAYGADMHRYVAAAGLWWWPVFGRGKAPLPDLGTDAVVHSHDLMLGPLVARLASQYPRRLAEFLVGYDGIRQIERQIGDDPELVATAWLEPDVTFGGLGGPAARPAVGQYMPAVVQWALPAGGVGTVVVRCTDPTEARATDGVLRVTTVPAATGPAPVEVVVSTGDGAPLAGAMVEPGRWNLPGLVLRVQTDAVVESAAVHDTDLVVTYRPAATGLRLTVRRVGDA
jgi:hypothetical protein